MKPRRSSQRLTLFLTLLVATGTIAGCSCEIRLQQLHRHCPDCITEAQLTDTLFLQPTQHDTTLILSPTLHDTFFVETERVSLQIIRHTDTLTTTLHTKPDTVVFTRTLTVPAPHRPPTSSIIALAAIFGIMLAAIIKLLKS